LAIIRALGRTPVWAVLAITLFAAGCAAPTQRLSSEDRSKHRAVRISDKVEKAPEPFLLAPGTGGGLMFGAVGGALASAGIEDARKAFSAYVDRNAISIQKIAREEVEAALRASGKFPIAGPSEASAPQMIIAVPQYGFGVTHLLGSSVVPVLWMKCDMVDGAGRVIWSASGRMLPSIASPIEPTTWDAMRDNPAVIEAEWRKAARHIARQIVDEI
jgi:hypothetical protein